MLLNAERFRASRIRQVRESAIHEVVVLRDCQILTSGSRDRCLASVTFLLGANRHVAGV